MLLLAGASCKKNKDGDSEKITLTFTQTQCSAPWHHDIPRDATFLSRLENWLETKTAADLSKTPTMKMLDDKV